VYLSVGIFLGECNENSCYLKNILMNSSKPPLPPASILEIMPLNVAVRLNIFNARQYKQLSHCIDFYFCKSVSDFVVSFISISVYFFYEKHFTEMHILYV